MSDGYVEATFVRVASTLADGTLRLLVEVEPIHSLSAFTLFRSAGTPMALVALRPGYAAADFKPDAAISDAPEEWGNYYAALYKTKGTGGNWFISRAVREQFGNSESEIKEWFYRHFGVDSLKKINPIHFTALVQSKGLLWTLPLLFKEFANEN